MEAASTGPGHGAHPNDAAAMPAAERAVRALRTGRLTCAQAILIDLRERGWDIEEDLVAMSSALGASGYGGPASGTCGCVSATVLVTSRRLARFDPMEKVLADFLDQFGSASCRDLVRRWRNDFVDSGRACQCEAMIKFTVDSLLAAGQKRDIMATRHLGDPAGSGNGGIQANVPEGDGGS